jgi:hypothetical protein
MTEQEKRQFEAGVNHYLGSLYERLRREATAQRKQELGEPEDEHNDT